MEFCNASKVRSVLVGIIIIGFLGMASVCWATEDTWTKKADMPTARYTLSSSTVDGIIYAIGGDPGASTVEAYDPATDTWTRKADMPTGRACLATCVVNGKIYAVGGAPSANEGMVALPAMEVYDPATDTWTKKADMPTPRMWLSASLVDGIIYAIGGMPSKGATALSTVEAYDPATDTWTSKTDIPTARAALGAGVVDGIIYAIDGQTGISTLVHTVEAYDPAEDTWTKKSDIPTGRGGLNASVVDGKIYAIGGYYTDPLSTVEVYDPVTDTWTGKANMPTARVYLSTSAVNGKIYAIGGGTAHGVYFSTVEEYDTGLGVPSPDFNGNGIVDFRDLLRLIESWDQDDPMVDIAPPPFGDGIVDVLDLELLMSFWEQAVNDSTLIANWKLDETDGEIAHDSTGWNDAVVFGNAIWQPEGGKVDGALELDGIDDYIGTDPVAELTSGPFSIFAWIKGGAPGQAIISQENSGNLMMADASEGKLMTDFAYGRIVETLVSETVITDGNWHRVGLTWDRTEKVLYVDDIEVASKTGDAGISEDGLYIGAGKSLDAGTFFLGLIDDVRIHDRAIIP